MTITENILSRQALFTALVPLPVTAPVTVRLGLSALFHDIHEDRPVGLTTDNHSRSAPNVLRELHYQLPPKAQGKLACAVAGEVFDVAVDIDGSCVAGQGRTERTALKKQGPEVRPAVCRSAALLRDKCLTSHDINRPA